MGIGVVVKVHNHDFADRSNAWYITTVLDFWKKSNNTLNPKP
jgi:hypothetical protein